MSLEITLKSACGKSSTKVDLFDANLNPDGFICCDNCESIIDSRSVWYTQYNFNSMKGNK